MHKTLSLLLLFGSICATAFDASAQIKPVISAPAPSATELRARKMYERLTGVKIPPDSPVLVRMAALINSGDLLAAAKIATADDNFLNVTVKLMALEMSTRNETVQTPLNDMVASFIGVARDQTDARELLSGNFYYMGKSPSPDIVIRSELGPDLLAKNNHYLDLESKGVNLAKNLFRVEGQKLINHAISTDAKNFTWVLVDNPDPAGVLTSRSLMGEHTYDGTNRRMVEYVFREFMCVPLIEWADGNATDAQIGRDIDRFPAGDHSKFLTSCKGCHTGMDGFRGAFAKWDTQDETTHGRAIMHSSTTTKRRTNDHYFSYGFESDSRGVTSKMNKNNTTYPSGHTVMNDSFVNNATRPANMALFGWRGNYQGGQGVKEFGTMIANSRRFSRCMAKRAFKAVCRKEIPTDSSAILLSKWGDEFEASGYKLKSLFENIATKPECLN